MTVNKDLFWQLLEKEYHGAMMFCRKLMADRERGDDLFQDSVLAAYNGFDSLRDHSAFKPWLYRVMINCFKMTIRRPWWKRLTSLSTEDELQLTGDNPIDRHSARRWLDRAFKVLSPTDQALVVLFELEGWPVMELAGLYGISDGAVKTRLSRARSKMKKSLIRFSGSTEDKRVLSEDGRCIVAKPDSE